MESISLQQKEIAKDLLEQIRGAIDNLLEWNKEYSEADDLLKSPGGMKTLAANCMLIEAIGESVKKIVFQVLAVETPEREFLPAVETALQFAVRRHPDAAAVGAEIVAHGRDQAHRAFGTGETIPAGNALCINFL